MDKPGWPGGGKRRESPHDVEINHRPLAAGRQRRTQLASFTVRLKPESEHDLLRSHTSSRVYLLGGRYDTVMGARPREAILVGLSA